MEEVDATVNSDEETDFTKMDLVCMSCDCHVTSFIMCYQGNRKGPVKRWDFENDDDYSDYQSNREALPK